MNMCKFPGIDDSEYKKVAAEISRHIDRVKGQLDQESNGECQLWSSISCVGMRKV